MTIADVNAVGNQDFDESLREKLASRRYVHWDALLGEGYKTREEQVLRALMATLKRDYCDVINHEYILRHRV
ncbi:hypothetical protein SGGMMB4_02215 [Sodalis glossinidius str. 'morsitans']|uniref:Uncharacterized protein n=1 Tax=Sodalis glossinidius (strain morsitans) TaxID=343509 RepID=A0A193QIB8_SODGM|nr:hypothetical protein SGGMMB4_02215 [Sodalis glossinidius str. 'morsitans']